jgi:16S rRNA (cytosine967-C5)-methyltransferase
MAFDKVLCDVPCSGLGIIAKKPDIRYKSLSQIDNLPNVQLAILNNCSKYVRVGGEIVYSTCTLNKKENEDVVRTFLSQNPDFEALEFTLGDIKSEDGCFTFFPNKHETDGFFVSKMVRKN